MEQKMPPHRSPAASCAAKGGHPKGPGRVEVPFPRVNPGHRQGRAFGPGSFPLLDEVLALLGVPPRRRPVPGHLRQPGDGLGQRWQQAELAGVGEPPVLLLVDRAGVVEPAEVDQRPLGDLLRAPCHVGRSASGAQPQRPIYVHFGRWFAAQQAVEGPVEQRAGEVLRIRVGLLFQDFRRPFGAAMTHGGFHVRHRTDIRVSQRLQ
jgi:hypothetical protein